MLRSMRRGDGPRMTALSDERLERRDRRLLAVLERDFAEALRRAGRERLLCAPGCTDCCHGPFPITRLDAWRLARGLAELSRSDPARAARIAERAERAVATLSPGFPGDPATGELAEDDAALDRFFEQHAALACPALEPASGRCELYGSRPVSCRTYGPPVRFGDELVPPCRLCFVGADPSTVERCRIEPDRDELEATILREMGAAGDDRESLIAFALARRGS